jgi:Mn2+/Fe2+ NRAMP family transporter
MLFSVLVMFAIIAATAATLGVHHQAITSAAQAAEALKPIAGNASSELFAAGFIGSGILAVPVLAASGSAGLAGLLDTPRGLDRSPRKAPVLYGLLVVGLVAGRVAHGQLPERQARSEPRLGRDGDHAGRGRRRPLPGIHRRLTGEPARVPARQA